MEYLFVGYQELDFSDDDGNKIEGVNIFIVGHDESVTGRKAIKKFISPAFRDRLKLDFDNLIDKNVLIAFNEKGKIAMMKVI